MTGSRLFALACAASVALASFLLFQVQPLISKAILPWFGGGTGVWTACLVFFQVGLFAANAYAHGLVRLRRTGLAVHLALLGAALATLPITPGEEWQPADASRPTARILALLAAHVGLPYFLLAANAPVVQSWLAARGAGAATYRLFAVSNLASMAGLLTFPFLFEPRFAISTLGGLWSAGFAAFAVLAALLVGASWKRARSTVRLAAQRAEAAPAWRERALWLLLSAGASSALLAVSQHVSRDVAPIPFLWVLPLALYLLSFVLCFDHAAWYPPRWFGWASIVTLGLLTVASLDSELGRALTRLQVRVAIPSFGQNVVLEVQAYLTALFLLCMLSHGELSRRRPAPHHLTDFYLTLAAGGALGGILVGVACPLVFSSYAELGITLAGGLALSLWVLWREERSWIQRTLPRRLLAGAVAGSVLLLGTASQWRAQRVPAIASERSFYGVLHVEEHDPRDPARARRALYHGRVLHGVQLLDPARRNEPIAYYARGTGVGVALDWLGRQGPLRVGVIGLGAGMLLAYGRPGDTFRFYEIDPAAVALARNYFSFLGTSAAAVQIREGDGRLSLEREPDQHFDLLVLDGFSGDAIPTHLLTVEAVQLYLRHLSPRGVLAVQISNRHLDLRPVVARLAGRVGLRALLFETPGGHDATEAGSTWMLMAADPAFLERATPLATRAAEPDPAAPLWTDQWSSLWAVIDPGGADEGEGNFPLHSVFR
jgi:SAM-dependent methyltransferase